MPEQRAIAHRCHPNEIAHSETEILQGGIKYNLEHFILEALKTEEVKNTPNTNVMNSHSDWGVRDSPEYK